MEHHLLVDNLAVTSRIDNSVIVHPLSFKVSVGKPVNLLGETGSGKSLIAQAILGNLTKDLKATGKVYIGEVEYLSQPETKRQQLWGRRLGILPQEPWLSLNPTKRSLSQISEVYNHVRGKKKNDARQAAKTDMERFELQSAERKYPHELSGGMAQRLVFCCTMAGGAQILIVDEPTKGLDKDQKTEVIKQLKTFIENDGILLVITHDIVVAEQLGGQTIVIKDGMMMEKNQTTKIFSSPENKYTKELINAAPRNWPAPSFFQTSQTPVIGCAGVTKTYSGHLLFSRVDLSIKKGEIFGLFGPSGSGKSTLGNILLDLVKPDTGKVTRSPKYEPFQFLKIYQDPPATFSPYHTLRNSLDDFMKLHNLDYERFNGLMAQLNLDSSLLTRDPGNISGGELQRFAIVRALMLNPVFLFADEPTSRLDPITQKETLSLMCKTVWIRECGMLLVSHDVEMLQKCCDRVITLDE